MHVDIKYLFTASTEPSMGTPAPLSKRTPLMSNKTPLIFLLLFHEAIVLYALLPPCLYFNMFQYLCSFWGLLFLFYFSLHKQVP